MRAPCGLGHDCTFVVYLLTFVVYLFYVRSVFVDIRGVFVGSLTGEALESEMRLVILRRF